jgi:hypothetical protein
MKAIFFRVLEADDKATALLEAIREPNGARGSRRFEVDDAGFAAVPGSPFAYWVSERVRGLFSEEHSLEAPDGTRIARRGLGTNDDFRFLRLWVEVQGLFNDWPSLAKGGIFSRFYASLPVVVNWQNNGAQLRAFFIHNGESPTRNIRSESEYRRPGLTWPRRTNGLSLRAMPSGCIFADKGPAAFVENDDSDHLLALAAVTNSQAFALFVSLQLARTELAQSYEVGLIQRTPVPNLNPGDRSSLSLLARRAWSLKRSLDTSAETSHAFVLPALLQVEGHTLAARASAWGKRIRATEAELATIQRDIDERCFDLYGIDDADRRAVNEGFGGHAATEEREGTNSDADAEIDVDSDVMIAVDDMDLASELIAWAVGVAFGRFDIRVATGVRRLPAEPEPFDPLPVCSPAMLTGDDGLPLACAPIKYPLAFAENGILVDDPGHAHDLTATMRAAFEQIFNASADEWWNDAGALLNRKDHDLRGWLAAGFFEYHLKRHSKSRRKAPIVWQLAVPSERYSIWLYAHRLNRDSFIQIQNDVVTPKLAHEERQLTSLMQSAGDNSSTKERKEIETQETFVEELRALLDEVKRIAPLWRPSLDDGVILTMAPLWRLVPQHKAWQKELKSKWNELVAGKYDWAHLAMHLWPERVAPKCATDRSLAIAHGLDDVFWFEDEDGNWKPYEKPQRPIADLVRERASTAVKAALKSLLDAPEPASGSKRSSKAKAA